MRQYFLAILAVVAVAFVGCKNNPFNEQNGSSAYISFDINSIAIDVETTTKAAALPSVNDFTITITPKGAATPLHTFLYENRPAQPLKLEAGEYVFDCFYGDIALQTTDKPAYNETQTLSLAGAIEAQTVTFNPKRTHYCFEVVYPVGFDQHYADYKISVSSPALPSNIEFGQNAGLPVYYFKIGAAYNATLEATKKSDNSAVNVVLADVAEGEAKTYHQLNLLFPAPRFDAASKSFVVVKTVGYFEGDNVNQPAITLIKSAHPIKSVSYTLDGNAVAPSELGIIESSDTYNKTIDFTTFVVSQLVAGTVDGSKTLVATVTDVKDKTASQEIVIVTEEPQFNITSHAGSMWSKTADLRVSIADAYVGKFSPSTVEYSTDGSIWQTANYSTAETDNANTKSYEITGLTANTEYSFRAKMGDYYANIGNLTTETPTQVPNSGFEDWRIDEVNRPSIFSAYHHYYKPWNKNAAEWWNTSNSRCFTYNGAPTQYNNPTSVLYTKNAKVGGKTAEIRSVKIAVGGRSNVCGKLIIGSLTSGGTNGLLTGNNNPEYLSEGRPFSVRPDKVKFWYKYDVYGTDNYVITVRVRSGDIIIGEKIVTGNQTVSDYQQMELEIPYTRTDLKATSLYICFASSQSDDFSYRDMSVSYPDGWSSGWKAEVGSILWVDDVTLIYDK